MDLEFVFNLMSTGIGYGLATGIFIDLMAYVITKALHLLNLKL